MMDRLLALPAPVLAGLAVLVAVQLVLQVLAIVDLVRRPATGVTLPKWLWAVIVVLGEILGAILYWALGRKQAAAVDACPAAPAAARAANAADALYGTRRDDASR